MKKLTLVLLLSVACMVNAADKQPIKLILDWFVNPTHAPIIIAQEKGYFSDHGLAVEIITPSDPADPPKLVAMKQADIALDYQPEFYLQQKAGLPIARIGTLVNQPLRVMIALQSDHITTLADLKGKTIAYSTPGIDTAILNTMLAFNGVKPNQVKLLAVHYDLVQALLTKQVDAVSGVYRTVEVPQIESMGKPLSIFYPEQNGVPSFDEMIFITNASQANRPQYKAFLEAVKEGVAFVETHPDESFQLLIKHHPELNNAFNKKSFALSLSYFAKDPLFYDKVRYAKFQAWMKKEGLS